MQEEKARTGTQSGGRFIDTLIEQWMSRTGSEISLPQTEEEQQVAEGSNVQDGKQQSLQIHERVIQSLKRKLRESQEAQASLTASLEMDARNKEEIQTKLNATWAYIDNITEYLNYVRESLANFEQHRANLSTIYDDVILKQQQVIQKLQLNDAKSKDRENYIAELKSKSLLQEERLQEAIAEKNKLSKQLGNTEYELQLQINEAANKHAEEKLMLVKEQQRLLLEYENLQSRLQTVEKEKCDIAKSAAQLENKLLLQEEKMQETLTEQNKLQKQAEKAKREFFSQKNELVSAHAKEKNLFVEEQQRLQLKSKSLQSQLNMLEQDKINTTEIVVQKDALISEYQNEITMYKNQIDVITARYNATCTEREELTERRNIQEKEIRTKTEKIQNLEALLNMTKQKDACLINDLNRIEKKLTNEIDYSKNLENKLSNVQKELQLAHKQNAEMQKVLEKTKSANELANIELQQQLKALQKEKEIMKRENARAKVSTTSLNDSDEDKPSSQTLDRSTSMKRQNQNEQEAEVPSEGKKFFKTRSGAYAKRTYAKRQD